MCLFQYVIVRVFSCALRESSTPDVWGSDGGFGFSVFFFFSSRRRHTRCLSDWSSDVCSSDLRRRGIRAARRVGGGTAEVLLKDDFRQGLDLSSTWGLLSFPPFFLADDGIVTTSNQGLFVKIGRASCREEV